jgi:hypothetical protein
LESKDFSFPWIVWKKKDCPKGVVNLSLITSKLLFLAGEECEPLVGILGFPVANRVYKLKLDILFACWYTELFLEFTVWNESLLTWEVFILESEFLKVRIDPPSLMLYLIETWEFFGGISENLSSYYINAYLALF